MWTEGLVKIVGDRSESGGKYVVANVDIPPGDSSLIYCAIVLNKQLKNIPAISVIYLSLPKKFSAAIEMKHISNKKLSTAS